MHEPDLSFETRIAKGQARMNAKQIVIGFAVLAASSVSLLAQTPVLGSIEAPYANLQGTLTLASHNWGPGAVAYGPVGTPLVLSGSDLGDTGTVQFIAYKSGVPDTSVAPVTASPTMWNSTMIFVPVPAGAYTGMVQVKVEGKTSNLLPFIVTPGNYSASCPAGPTQSQLQIVTASLHDGSVSQSYSATLSSEGGTGNITWSIVNGSLPAGLTLNQPTTNPPTQASISGTPTAAVSQTPLTFEVTDSSSPHQSNQAVLDLTIEQQQLSSTTVYQYTASYDGNGNVSSSSDTVMGSWQYNYDAFNHVRSGTAVSGGSGSQDFTGQNLCWAYDSYGNRTAQSQPPVGAQCSTQNTAVWVYANNNNQVSGVIAPGATQPSPSPLGYDQAGNVTADLTTGNSYSYDAEGRICAVASPALIPGGQPVLTGYLYDAEGNRIGKGSINSMSCDPTANGFQVTQNYVLGPSGEELSMFDGGNNWQRTNVYAAGKLVGTYDLIADPNSSSPATIPALHFHLEDPLGTRRMQLSSIGQPETDIQSLPFGDELYAFPDVNAPPTADDATPLHFTGKERDAESGNDYFGARYYASMMGRWLSPDWSAKVMPVPYAKLDNPQSLNLYSYVWSNPLARADLDGHAGNCQKGSWCEALNNAWNQIHQIRQDATAVVQSGTVTGELGFGFKASAKIGSGEAHLGATLHDEKTYSAADRKLKDLFTGGSPITDKLEADAGVKLGSYGGGGEVGLMHSGGDDAPIKRYGPEPEGTAEHEGGGEISANGETVSLAFKGYFIIGGGVTFTVDQKALIDVVKDIPAAVDKLTSTFLPQN
jgi:RHS repeat-associated protein